MRERNQTNDILAHQENTPAYEVLQQHNLLTTTYRKTNFENIFDENDLVADSSHGANLLKRLAWGYYCGGCCFYNSTHTESFINAGEVGLFCDNENRFLFASPGLHNIFSPFIKQVGTPLSVMDNQCITHGNRTIVTVEQGKLGYALDRGQPVLLPPGLHCWRSETLQFQKTFNLFNHHIDVGPLTILTVDEGYAAITQNNGKQEILEGGKTHLLPHQKWRFEKFITLKIQTDDLEKIRAASADNIIMECTSTVVWRISDVHTAALFGADTMASSGKAGEVSADITKLRRDVLKQAIASLASFIGSVNYSDSFHIAAAAQRKKDHQMEEETIEPHATVAVMKEGQDGNLMHGRVVNENPMFDGEGLSECVRHANAITVKYGVEITSINIISANPVDKNLTASLASGAVAAAEALQAETAARGQAKAICINAEADALQKQIAAEAECKAQVALSLAAAEAEENIAQGKLKAAELLQVSDIACELARIDKSATAIKQGDKFFFGNNPDYMKNVLLPMPADHYHDHKQEHHHQHKEFKGPQAAPKAKAKSNPLPLAFP